MKFKQNVKVRSQKSEVISHWSLVICQESARSPRDREQASPPTANRQPPTANRQLPKNLMTPDPIFGLALYRTTITLYLTPDS